MEINKESYETLLPTLKSLRAQKVLRHILDHGSVSTEELRNLGYGHPPRAAQDLKEAGVSLETKFTKHPVTGNRMGYYVLAETEPVNEDTFSGRGALPKNLENDLYDHYGVRCNLDNYEHGRRSLQADHRVPYIVGGDPVGFHLDDWQILCASHQRRKSFECEQCPNIIAKDVEICKTCYWAFPENYSHVATKPVRRLDIVWGEDDILVHDYLADYAARNQLSLEEAARRIIAERLGGYDF